MRVQTQRYAIELRRALDDTSARPGDAVRTRLLALQPAEAPGRLARLFEHLDGAVHADGENLFNIGDIRIDLAMFDIGAKTANGACCSALPNSVQQQACGPCSARQKPPCKSCWRS